MPKQYWWVSFVWPLRLQLDRVLAENEQLSCLKKSLSIVASCDLHEDLHFLFQFPLIFYFTLRIFFYSSSSEKHPLRDHSKFYRTPQLHCSLTYTRVKRQRQSKYHAAPTFRQDIIVHKSPRMNRSTTGGHRKRTRDPIYIPEHASRPRRPRTKFWRDKSTARRPNAIAGYLKWAVAFGRESCSERSTSSVISSFLLESVSIGLIDALEPSLLYSHIRRHRLDADKHNHLAGGAVFKNMYICILLFN